MPTQLRDDRDVVDRLVDLLNAIEGGGATFANQGQGWDGYSQLAAYTELAQRARDMRSSCPST